MKYIKWLVRLLLVGAFSYLVVDVIRHGQWQGVLPTMERLAIWLVPILIVYGVSFYLKAVASALALQQPVVRPALHAIFIALFVNHVMPFKVGEFVRVYVLKREARLTWTEATANVVLMRALDTLSLLLLVAVGAFVYLHTVPLLQMTTMLALVVPLLLFYPFRNRRLFAPYWRHIRQLWSWRGIAMIALVFVSWMMEAVIVYTVAYPSITGTEALFVNSMTIIGQAFQFTPGGLTTYEAVMSYSLKWFTVASGTALTIAATSHAIKFLFSFIVGPISMAMTNMSWRQLKRVWQKKGSFSHEESI